MQESKSVIDIPKKLGISVNNLFTWLIRYQLHGYNTFQDPAIRLPTNEQQEELRHLKKDVSELKMKPYILKKALSIFPKSIH